MAKYFYGRVSTKEQNLARQLAVARNYTDIPDENIYCDKQSGKNFDRKAYTELKGILKSGDEVIIKEFDRLGRNKDAVKKELAWFKENSVTVRILDVPTTLCDFGGQEWIRDMVNNVLIEVLGAIAEQEYNKIQKRQREGLDEMRVIDGKRYSEKKGTFCGRPRKDDDRVPEYYAKYTAGEMTAKECCEALNMKRSTWYDKIRALSA